MKTLYLWMKQGLRRIEFYTKEDTAKKTPIPQQGKFADAHEKHLKQRGKKP
jgi:hypothetical protein